MKSLFAIAAPLGLLILLIIVGKSHRSTAGNQWLEEVVAEGVADQRWSEPYLSQIFSSNGAETFGVIMDSYEWPGHPNRGLGAKVLLTAAERASEVSGEVIVGININGLIQDDHINIYFFDSSKFPELDRFAGNCTYTGIRNIILCDRNYLRRFQDLDFVEHQLQQYLEPGEDLAALLTNPKSDYRIAMGIQTLIRAQHVLLWVLVHEIGHLANSHKPVGRYRKLIAKEGALADAREMEREADQFALEVLSDYSDRGFGLVMGGMINLAGEQIAVALDAPDTILASPLHEIDAEIPVRGGSGTHPPLLVRALDALAMFEEFQPYSFAAEEPVFAKLRSQVIIKK